MEIWEYDAIIEDMKDFIIELDNTKYIKVEDVINIIDSITEWGGY